MVAHLQAYQGLARTLATLMASGSGPSSDQLTEGTRILEHAVTDLLGAGVREGTIRGDADAHTLAGAVKIALHGIGAAHDRPGWQGEADGLIDVVLDGLRPR